MIYINLLPVREIKRRKKAKKQIVTVGTAFFCFLIFLALLIFNQSSEITTLRKKENQLKQEKEPYVRILADIKKIEADKEILIKRIEIIHTLRQYASLTVRVLDEIANVTPPRRMWLTSLSQSGNELKLTGMALDEQTIAKYMDDLERSPYIQQVNLINAAMKKYAERELKEFSITCLLGLPDVVDK